MDSSLDEFHWPLVRKIDAAGKLATDRRSVRPRRSSSAPAHPGRHHAGTTTLGPLHPRGRPRRRDRSQTPRQCAFWGGASRLPSAVRLCSPRAPTPPQHRRRVTAARSSAPQRPAPAPGTGQRALLERGIGAAFMKPEALERLSLGEGGRPVDAVVVSALPPEALGPARAVCRAVRGQTQELPLLVGLWEPDKRPAETPRTLGSSGREPARRELRGMRNRPRGTARRTDGHRAAGPTGCPGAPAAGVSAWNG
jgi:hypothetical protein